eukprot:TRINITY_DN42809_c0_g1_i1.p1 TRINITY_DN42809_c0_g1~~TRINITY_DN42809_c0_g1_i1.p1  ORF type:complete len:101 (-),score=25.60 TRINITY_DN42809_c0_g1_i1:111-413(-)
MIRRPPRSTLSSSSAASDVYKRQLFQSNGYPYHFVTRTLETSYSLSDLAIALARKPSCLMIVDQAPVLQALAENLQQLTTNDLSEVFFCLLYTSPSPRDS